MQLVNCQCSQSQNSAVVQIQPQFLLHKLPKIVSEQPINIIWLKQAGGKLLAEWI